MPGAWWSKSDANLAALARVNDADVAALLERAARARDNDGIRIDAGAEPRALWQWQSSALRAGRLFAVEASQRNS